MSNELGPKIDALYALREARLDLERKVKTMQEEEFTLRGEILDLLEQTGLQKASGSFATAGIKRAIIPIVTDWDELFRYIAENDRFDLVQKRISVLAWRETHENTEIVPGTAAVEDIDISLTKSSRN